MRAPKDFIEIGRSKDGSPFHVPVSAFDYHTHILSSTQSGKTFLLKHIFGQLALRKNLNRRGQPESALIFIDPKGNAFPWLKRWCYQKKLEDRLILIDPAEADQVPGFNPMQFVVPPGTDADTRNNLMIAHANVLADSFIRLLETSEYQTSGPVVREMTFLIMHALMNAGLTMADAREFLNRSDATFRDAVVHRITDPYILSKWHHFELLTSGRGMKAFELLDMKLGSVARRLETYSTHYTLRRMLGSPNAISWAEVLDKRKIVLVNLGEIPGLSMPERQLLGTQLISQIVDEALSRNSAGRREQVPCYLFVDECQYFISPQIDRALSTVGQFKLRLFLAHQFLEQLYDSKRDGDPKALIASVRENCKTKIVFNINNQDTAKVMAEDIVSPWFNLKTPKQERLKQLSKVVPIQIRSRSQATGQSWGTGRSQGYSSGAGSGSGISTPSPHPDQSMPQGPTSIESDYSGSTTASGESESSGGSEAFSESVTDTFMAVPETIVEFDYFQREELLHMAIAEFMTLPQRHGIMKFYGGDVPIGFETAQVDPPTIAPLDALRLDRRLRTRDTLYLPAADIDKCIEDRRQKLLVVTEPPTRVSDIDPPAGAGDDPPSTTRKRARPRNPRKP